MAGNKRTGMYLQRPFDGKALKPNKAVLFPCRRYFETKKPGRSRVIRKRGDLFVAELFADTCRFA